MARCALEESDSAQVRVEKITPASSRQVPARYPRCVANGVGHDLRVTEVQHALETGIFLGARKFGGGRQRQKRCLVLDRERFRYQAYLSDISGQDVKEHADDPAKAIKAVRDWLSHFAPKDVMRPGGKKMAKRYGIFLDELPALLREVDVEREELIYNDYTTIMVGWLRVNPWG